MLFRSHAERLPVRVRQPFAVAADLRRRCPVILHRARRVMDVDFAERDLVRRERADDARRLGRLARDPRHDVGRLRRGLCGACGLDLDGRACGLRGLLRLIRLLRRM